jgi:hypothetical protein
MAKKMTKMELQALRERPLAHSEQLRKLAEKAQAELDRKKPTATGD